MTLDPMYVEMAARERATCAAGFTVIRYTHGWVVVHPLPADSPYGRAYLTRDGLWSVTADYFATENEAYAARYKAKPPCDPGDNAEQARRNMRRGWRWRRLLHWIRS